MDRTAVTSSLVKSVGYDPTTKTLEVELHSPDEPRAYHYAPIGHETFLAMINPAMSAGRLLNEIKRDPSVSFRRLDIFEIEYPNVDVVTTEAF